MPPFMPLFLHIEDYDIVAYPKGQLPKEDRQIRSQRRKLQTSKFQI